MVDLFNVSPDPHMPDLPLPEAFRSLTAWTFCGNPYVSPAMGIAAGLGSDAVPPPEDVVILHPPPKYELFDTPRGSEYILVPPNPPPTKDDPTGMKRMMEFLGINKELVNAALPPKPDSPNTNVSDAASATKSESAPTNSTATTAGQPTALSALDSVRANSIAPTTSQPQLQPASASQPAPQIKQV